MPSKVSAAFSYSENRDNRHYMKRSQFNEQEFSLEQQRVRTMMKHAWSGYYEYARDSDELMPLTKKGSNWTQSSLSLTAIDALDTLFIMKLETEYQQAKDIILKYDFDTIDYPINHFETNIRVLGGLLSAYEMDPDNRYLDLAIDLADRLLKAFNTPTGFPYFDIDLANGTKFNGPFFLSNAGTLQLEFQYLSDVTGNSIYQDTALFIYEQLHFMDKPIPGLFPKDISATELKFGGPNYGIAGNADSFYEYLLKIYVSTGLEKFKAWYVTAAKVEFINKALVEHILVKKDGYLYAPDAIGSEHQPEFYHLTCFAGGMFALGSQTINTDDEIDYFGIGLEMTESCMEIYKQTKTGLGGEAFVIEDGKIKPLNLTYTQRPEVIESVFYMWRYSHDEKYREFGRTMLDNIDKHLYNPVAYHTMNELGEPTDRMETFFLAETLKYLYLLFCQDDIVSLNDYVFNTEAHPISIRGKGQRSDPSKWVPIKETSEYLPPVGTLKPESNI